MKLAFVLLAATVAAPLSAQTWNLQWSDEFTGDAGSAPNPANWKYDVGNHDGFGNGEIEYYCEFGSNQAPCSTSRPNTYLDGQGHLVIRAIQTNGQWTSGRLLTSGKQAFEYGRIEARMKMEAGAGFWPAFWMLGENIDQVKWPNSGEQDIMEWVQRYTPTTTSSTVHGPGYSGGGGIGTTFTFPNGGCIDDAGYHVYGVIWSENKMAFYRDNPANPYFTLTPDKIPAGTKWVYNSPFFLLLNFAIGSGGFPGKTDETTPAAGTAQVDYVRVYRPSETIDAGKTYVITGKESGSCIAGIKEGGGRGTLVQQANCAAAASNQEWTFTAAGGGYYRIALPGEQESWETVKGAVGLRTAGRSHEQEFMPVSNSDGTYRFTTRKGAECVTGPAAGGNVLRQTDCNGDAAQSWVLTQVP